MSTFVGMSWNTFDENREEIEAEVHLLSRLSDPKRRKRFWLAEVYETSSNERLAEVLSTNFGPVVVYSTQVGTMANWVERPPGQGVSLHLRQSRKWRPRTPLTGEPDQVFYLMSRSNTGYSLRGLDLVRFLTDGSTVDGRNPNLTFKRVGGAPSTALL